MIFSRIATGKDAFIIILSSAWFANSWVNNRVFYLFWHLTTTKLACKRFLMTSYLPSRFRGFLFPPSLFPRLLEYHHKEYLIRQFSRHHCSHSDICTPYGGNISQLHRLLPTRVCGVNGSASTRRCGRFSTQTAS